MSSPYFSAVICNIPPAAPTHSSRDVNMTTFNHSVTYTCDEGYSFTASDYTDNTRQIHCTELGTFDRELMETCEGD